ncbi:MAG TPA: FtsX-like permease family protein [Telluria sp.]|nr:FtsX-like permease family protein [Telluria sp.]
MSPHRLALRTILLGRPRSVLAILVIAASLCVLDLFSGHLASQRGQLEYQAVIGERLGHLAISRTGTAHDGSPQSKAFDAAEAAQVKRIAEASGGVALVLPQMSVSGIAYTGKRSALFFGEGIGAASVAPELPGKLGPKRRTGIALSNGQAQALGLGNGASLTLMGATLDARSVPLDAEVVEVFSSADFGAGARSLLMPFEMAQALLDTARTERFVVYLSDPRQLDARRQALLAALRQAGLRVEIRSWQDQSPAYAKEKHESELSLDSVAGMAFAVIAATVAATVSMNALERRREVATLRALGMHSSRVFLMFSAEAMWMASLGVLCSLVGSSVISWVVNRAALSYGTHHALKRAPMLVELDFERMTMAVVAALAVALLASLVPAFKAARADVAEGLA